MSASQCIKCERVVSMYEKYCNDCIRTYGVLQDVNFHKTHIFMNWDVERKAEFEKDVRLTPLAKVALSLSYDDLKEAVIFAEFLGKKKRKRNHAKHNH